MDATDYKQLQQMVGRSARTRTSTRNADLFLCRELQRRHEYPSPYDLQTRCEELYGWMPQYAEEIVRVMWEDLYAPATEAEIEAMRGPA